MSRAAKIEWQTYADVINTARALEADHGDATLASSVLTRRFEALGYEVLSRRDLPPLETLGVPRRLRSMSGAEGVRAEKAVAAVGAAVAMAVNGFDSMSIEKVLSGGALAADAIERGRFAGLETLSSTRALIASAAARLYQDALGHDFRQTAVRDRAPIRLDGRMI